MRRREIIALLGCAAVVQPVSAYSQEANRMRTVGILMPYAPTDDEVQRRIAAFRDELHRLGWTEGENVRIDLRWATDNLDRIRAEATDLVTRKPDVIILAGRRVVPIVQQQTRSFPSFSSIFQTRLDRASSQA